ncbi:hypothetical protein KAU19_08510, partial [Candidatus Parcubacteria bacterium]|nr:hypothetical protein [Candidatus Parcubacteria bacterium]
MGKIHEVTIKAPSLGISFDDRKDNRFAHLISHFDAFSFKNKLVPTPGFEAEVGNNNDIVKFLWADVSGTPKLFGFDKTASGSYCHVKVWNEGTNQWTIDYTNDEGSSGGRDEHIFFHYKGYIYMIGSSDD